jgi:hypothetical protein
MLSLRAQAAPPPPALPEQAVEQQPSTCEVVTSRKAGRRGRAGAAAAIVHDPVPCRATPVAGVHARRSSSGWMYRGRPRMFSCPRCPILEDLRPIGAKVVFVGKRDASLANYTSDGRNTSGSVGLSLVPGGRPAGQRRSVNLGVLLDGEAEQSTGRGLLARSGPDQDEPQALRQLGTSTVRVLTACR